MDLDQLISTAERLGLEPETLDALTAVHARVSASAELSKLTDRLTRALAEDTPADAVLDVAESGLEQLVGLTDSRTLNLAFALCQVPAAEERRLSSGITAALTEATFADLPLWVRHFNKRLGIHGLTTEILESTQRYLRGDQVRIGSAMFDLVLFSGTITVFRHRFGRELSAQAANGRTIDLSTGAVTDVLAGPHPSGEWEVALDGGAPVLDVHLPANSFISRTRLTGSLQEAFGHFARRFPGNVPVGACGEAWLLDPQIRRLLPRSSGLHAVQASCSLYPSELPEAATLRRIFGPDVVRGQLAGLPHESMSTLQRAVVELLADPAAALTARGGFILREELASLTASRNDWRKVSWNS